MSSKSSRVYCVLKNTHSWHNIFVCARAQSCLTLCNPMDCSPLGPSVHGIPRQEFWNGLPFPPPGKSSQPRDSAHVSCTSCTGRWILYHCAAWDAPCTSSDVGAADKALSKQCVLVERGDGNLRSLLCGLN